MSKKDCINLIIDILKDYSFNRKYGHITIIFNAGKIQRISELEDHLPAEKVILDETFNLIKTII